MNHLYLKYFIAIATIAVLYAGYRYLPSRRIFMFFSLLIAGSAAFSFWQLFAMQHDNAALRQQRQMQILVEQPVFITWYEGYKKEVQKADYIWSCYNDDFAAFNDRQISLEQYKYRLEKLYQKSKSYNLSLAQQLPPNELSDADYKLCYAMLEKLRSYAAKQENVINLSWKAVNAPAFRQKTHDLQYIKLDDIRLRNAPVNLNIASEVITIRDNLTIF